MSNVERESAAPPKPRPTGKSDIDKLAANLIWRMTQSVTPRKWSERDRRLRLGRALFKFLTEGVSDAG